jgi:hypothetical protein
MERDQSVIEVLNEIVAVSGSCELSGSGLPQDGVFEAGRFPDIRESASNLIRCRGAGRERIVSGGRKFPNGEATERLRCFSACRK